MCLAIPGKILDIEGDDPSSRMGRVNFAGIVKRVNLSYVPEAAVGDYVIVHVGFAISPVDRGRGRKVFDVSARMDELAELEDGEQS